MDVPTVGILRRLHHTLRSISDRWQLDSKQFLVRCNMRCDMRIGWGVDGSIGSVMKMMCVFWRTTVVGLYVCPFSHRFPWPPRKRPRHIIITRDSGRQSGKPPVIDGVVDEGECKEP